MHREIRRKNEYKNDRYDESIRAYRDEYTKIYNDNDLKNIAISPDQLRTFSAEVFLEKMHPSNSKRFAENLKNKREDLKNIPTEIIIDFFLRPESLIKKNKDLLEAIDKTTRILETRGQKLKKFDDMIIEKQRMETQIKKIEDNQKALESKKSIQEQDIKKMNQKITAATQELTRLQIKADAKVNAAEDTAADVPEKITPGETKNAPRTGDQGDGKRNKTDRSTSVEDSDGATKIENGQPASGSQAKPVNPQDDSVQVKQEDQTQGQLSRFGQIKTVATTATAGAVVGVLTGWVIKTLQESQLCDQNTGKKAQPDKMDSLPIMLCIDPTTFTLKQAYSAIYAEKDGQCQVPQSIRQVARQACADVNGVLSALVVPSRYLDKWSQAFANGKKPAGFTFAADGTKIEGLLASAQAVWQAVAK